MSTQDNKSPYPSLEPWVLNDQNVAGVIGLIVAQLDVDSFLTKINAQPPFQAVRGVPALSRESPPGYELVGVTQAVDKQGQVIPSLLLGAECPGITAYNAAEVLSAPSGTILAFHYNCGQDWFTWAADGEKLAEFSWWLGMDEAAYGGTNPSYVAEEIRKRIGVDPRRQTDDPCAAAAALMTAVFGVVITPDLLESADFYAGAVKESV
jgi:hypothetical protein